MKASIIISTFRGTLTSPHVVFGDTQYHLMRGEEEVFRVNAEGATVEELMPRLKDMVKEEAQRRGLTVDI